MPFYTKFAKNRCFEAQKRPKTLEYLLDLIEYLDFLIFFHIFAKTLNFKLIMEKYNKTSIAHFIELKDRYAIDARLLGRRIRIRLSDDSFLNIIMPSIVIKNRCPEIGISGIMKKYNADLSDWGMVKSYDSLDNLDKMNVWISAVLVECINKRSGNLPNSGIIQAEAKKVLHSLQIINPDAIRIPSDEYNDDLCEIKMSVSISAKGKALPEIKCSMVLDDRKGKLSIADIKRAFHNANNPISVPYEMLNNARINIAQHDTRATVLNCATAIEVVLKRKVSAYLDKNRVPQALREYVLKQADGYEKLTGLCKKLCINQTRMPNVKKAVMEIRNRVIHGGHIPSNDESQTAFEKTKEALEVLNVPMFESKTENKN